MGLEELGGWREVIMIKIYRIKFLKNKKWEKRSKDISCGLGSGFENKVFFICVWRCEYKFLGFIES